MKRAIKSFRDAFRGVGYCLKEERHFRFHIAVAFYVFCVAPYFLISPAEWAVLILTVGVVLAAEAVNTAVERTVDLTSPDRHPLAGVAKDAAAGAVLIAALTAVAVAVFLLARGEGFARLWGDFCAHPVKPILLAVSLPAAAFLVFHDYSQRKV